MLHQRQVLVSPARFKIPICGRRFGKSVIARQAAIVGHGPRGPNGRHKRRGALEGGQIWWIMPALPQARDTWDAFEFALRGVWTKRNQTERFFDFPGGGRLQIKSSDEPDSLRGPGLNGVVFDEIKDHPAKAYKESVRPALADKHGWMLATGTASRGHSDENLASYLFRRAENRKGWERWQCPSGDNPLVTAAELEEMREDLGPTAFARECLASFDTADGGLFDISWLRCYDAEISDDPERSWPIHGPVRLGDQVEHLEACGRFATVDLAASAKTYSDYTAISSWAVASDGRLILLEVDRRKLDGADVLDALKTAVRRWRLDTIWVEKTSRDSKFLSIAADTEGLPIEEVVRGKGDKIMRAEPAAAAMKRGEIWVPRFATWLPAFKAELAAFPTKNVKDDQVDTLSDAIAVRDKPLGGEPAVGWS